MIECVSGMKIDTWRVRTKSDHNPYMFIRLARILNMNHIPSLLPCNTTRSGVIGYRPRQKTIGIHTLGDLIARMVLNCLSAHRRQPQNQGAG